MLNQAESKGLKLRLGWRESLNPDPSEGLERSDRHLWRLGAKDRLVPNGSKVHGSVIRRMEDQDKEYRPRNLTGSYVEVDSGETTALVRSTEQRIMFLSISCKSPRGQHPNCGERENRTAGRCRFRGSFAIYP